MKRAIKLSFAETFGIGRLPLRLGVEGALHSRRLRGWFIGICCCLPSLLVSTSKQTRLTFTNPVAFSKTVKNGCVLVKGWRRIERVDDGGEKEERRKGGANLIHLEPLQIRWAVVAPGLPGLL